MTDAGDDERRIEAESVAAKAEEVFAEIDVQLAKLRLVIKQATGGRAKHV